MQTSLPLIRSTSSLGEVVTEVRTRYGVDYANLARALLALFGWKDAIKFTGGILRF
jgi:hypothetical protein